MRKAITLVTVLALLAAAGVVHAQEGELTGTVDLQFLSNYIWRGFDIYDGRSAWQYAADVDLFDTGFGAQLFGSRAGGSGYENAEEIDLTLYYGSTIDTGDTMKTDYRLGWTYYGYPDEPRGGTSSGTAAHMQEFFATVAMPEICPAGVVPHYTIVKMWASEGDSTRAANGGWFHILGIGYDMSTAGLTAEIPEQIVHLSADLVYNDGAAPGTVNGSLVDHDWSHIVVGASTGFDLGSDLTLTPALYYQVSMDDSVNDEDEVWAALKLAYAF